MVPRAKYGVVCELHPVSSAITTKLFGSAGPIRHNKLQWHTKYTAGLALPLVFSQMLNRAVSRIFLLGGAGARAKPESLRRALKMWSRWRGSENFEMLDALRGAFPPSLKLKDIPTKWTFWVNFVGKTLRSDKKQFSRTTKFVCDFYPGGAAGPLTPL
jgi:hypothetical protein